MRRFIMFILTFILVSLALLWIVGVPLFALLYFGHIYGKLPMVLVLMIFLVLAFWWWAVNVKRYG